MVEMLWGGDRRVRIRAQFALAEEEAEGELVASLQRENQLARIHTMWALAMIDRGGEPQMQHIVSLLDDDDEEIVQLLIEEELVEAKKESSFALLMGVVGVVVFTYLFLMDLAFLVRQLR